MKAFNRIINPVDVQYSELEGCLIRLCDQFAINKSKAKLELKDFVHYAKSAPKTDFLNSLSNSDNMYATMFPNLAKLAGIYKVLPPHTADCERDFSNMKLIKTDIRNRMSENTLDCLMRISLEGPPLEKFPYERAVKLWASKKNRRYQVKLVH